MRHYGSEGIFILRGRTLDSTTKGLLKINKALGADGVINEFFQCGGREVRGKLLNIVNLIFEKGFYRQVLEPRKSAST